jgi:inhibitor of cysteine peptidase
MIPRITWLMLTFWMLAQSPLMAADATVTVTKEQSGREVALKVGGILQIELPSRGGTGYSWFAEAAGAPYLKLISQSTRTAPEPRPGAPVMQVWCFKAEKPGTTKIKMTYYRPWEGVGNAQDHFLIKLRIE